MKQVHLLISGFVQGVGFREHVRRDARKFGVMGWAKNLPDGRVEIVAQGDTETLEKFIKICKRGPFLSEVKDLSIEWQEPQEKFESFERKDTE